MTPPELDETLPRTYELEGTDATVADHDKEGTDATVASDDEEGTDATVADDDDKKVSAQETAKIPASEIVVRDIAVEAGARASLPADQDAAFGQWLAGSRLAPRN